MIEPSKYYHIYNHANGFENIFNEERNYHFFLEKYPFYISPIADTLAYCLMPNHFHLLIKIKSEKELRRVIENAQGLTGIKAKQNLERFGEEKEENNKIFDSFISHCFSNLFNSYTKSFNKVYNRRGSLFVPNYKRKEITSEEYLKQVFIYIHNNPVKHGFVRKPDKWNFSSYNAYIFDEETFLIKSHILSFFDSVESLKTTHMQSLSIPDDFIPENY